MADAPREAWITGIGIVSCLGEGAEAHWQALVDGRVNVDAERFAPYVVHPLAPVNLDKQIPKKGDQRQMEPWQRIGTYAAGLALDNAKVKGNAELLARMDMIVAAGGGERDEAVDSTILTGIEQAADPEAFLNERLMSDLRPTLFLAQLSNLLAGNISIVHGVTGSSRTFMGEESAGVDAVRMALSRIQAGRQRHRAGRRLATLRAQGHAAALRVRAGQPAGSLCAGLAARTERRLRARLARRVPGDRSAQPRRGARRQTTGTTHGRPVRARQDRAGRSPDHA